MGQSIQPCAVRASGAGWRGDGTFRVRLTDIAGNTARDFYLDWVAVKVYYQP